MPRLAGNTWEITEMPCTKRSWMIASSICVVVVVKPQQNWLRRFFTPIKAIFAHISGPRTAHLCQLEFWGPVLRRAKRPYTRDVAMQLYLFEQQLHSKGLHKYINAAECCNVRGSGLIARQKSVFQTGAAPVLHDGQHFRWSGWPFYLFLNH